MLARAVSFLVLSVARHESLLIALAALCRLLVDIVRRQPFLNLIVVATCDPVLDCLRSAIAGCLEVHLIVRVVGTGEVQGKCA